MEDTLGNRQVMHFLSDVTLPSFVAELIEVLRLIRRVRRENQIETMREGSAGPRFQKAK